MSLELILQTRSRKRFHSVFRELATRSFLHHCASERSKATTLQTESWESKLSAPWLIITLADLRTVQCCFHRAEGTFRWSSMQIGVRFSGCHKTRQQNWWLRWEGKHRQWLRPTTRVASAATLLLWEGTLLRRQAFLLWNANHSTCIFRRVTEPPVLL